LLASLSSTKRSIGCLITPNVSMAITLLHGLHPLSPPGPLVYSKQMLIVFQALLALVGPPFFLFATSFVVDDILVGAPLNKNAPHNLINYSTNLL
jgi:hypothetical protein